MQLLPALREGATSALMLKAIRIGCQRHGFLRDDIPIDDTIARTISRIVPEQFRLYIIRWMQDVSESTESGHRNCRLRRPGDKHSSFD